MTVATSNERKHITLPGECWERLQAEAQGEGSTVSQVILAHIQASQAGAQTQLLATLREAVAHLERQQAMLETLLTRVPEPPPAVDQTLFGAPVPVASTLPSDGPVPVAPISSRRGWFRRGDH